MILNWIYGTEMELEITTKTYTGIEAYQLIEMPLTVTPLAVLLRTSAGGKAELCAYYRADQDGAYTMRASAGDAPAYSRLHTDLGDALMLTCSGGTAAQPASLECVALGVKL